MAREWPGGREMDFRAANSNELSRAKAAARAPMPAMRVATAFAITLHVSPED